MKSIFNPADVAELTERINKLTPGTNPLWGKMSVGQMLAHCNVAYEMVYTNKHPKPGFFMRLLLKTVVKSTVCGPKPYKKNLRNAKESLSFGKLSVDEWNTMFYKHLNHHLEQFGV